MVTSILNINPETWEVVGALIVIIIALGQFIYAIKQFGFLPSQEQKSCQLLNQLLTQHEYYQKINEKLVKDGLDDINKRVKFLEKKHKPNNR